MEGGNHLLGEKYMSVTTVPIQPIKKGSLRRYWLGIALLAAVGGTLAYVGTQPIVHRYAGNDDFLKTNGKESGVLTTGSGLQYKVVKDGEGKPPTDDDVVLVKYKGTLRDGKVFDENPQAAFPVSGVVPGFSEGLKLMKRGGSYRLWISSNLGYGPEDQKNPQTGEVGIPGNSLLIFDVDLLEYKSRTEVEAMQKQMQEMQKKQGAAVGGGTAGAAPQGLPPELQQQLEQQLQGQGR
jgi:FKBP-type peptidyl-prolyl cis-trans isomerase FkpA